MLTNLLQEWAGQVVIRALNKIFLPIRLKCIIRYYLGLIVEGTPWIVANLWLIFRVLKKLTLTTFAMIVIVFIQVQVFRSLLHHFANPLPVVVLNSLPALHSYLILCDHAAYHQLIDVNPSLGPDMFYNNSIFPLLDMVPPGWIHLPRNHVAESQYWSLLSALECFRKVMPLQLCVYIWHRI